jgi:hypothetical protein
MNESGMENEVQRNETLSLQLWWMGLAHDRLSAWSWPIAGFLLPPLAAQGVNPKRDAYLSLLSNPPPTRAVGGES